MEKPLPVPSLVRRWQDSWGGAPQDEGNPGWCDGPRADSCDHQGDLKSKMGKAPRERVCAKPAAVGGGSLDWDRGRELRTGRRREAFLSFDKSGPVLAPEA